ncbi:peptidylprolyl isomerase [Sedimenticola sp.]|uniref:peptidylprolyl isomerase n=1 Tax=Sedimenticola sp. TaxID=1940285 RepID=UPI003D14C6E1
MNRSSLILGILLAINIALTVTLLTQFNAQFAQDNGEPIILSTLQTDDNNPVVATINDTEVTQTDLLPYLNEIASAEQLNAWGNIKSVPADVMKAVVDNMALDLIIMSKAKDSELDKNLKLQAVTNQNTRRIIKGAYLSNLSPTLVTDDQIRTEYEKLKASLDGKTEYRARHILLGSKKEADIIIKALKKEKRPFSELAKLFSLDEATAKRGGDLGYQLSGQLNEDFENVVSKLKVNVVSKPFQTSLGWHIAIVDDRRESKAMPLEQAAPIIRRKLEQQAVKQYLGKVLADAKIEMKTASTTSTSDATGSTATPTTQSAQK